LYESFYNLTIFIFIYFLLIMSNLTETEIAQGHIQYYEKLYRELNTNHVPDIPAGQAAEFLRGSGIPVPTLSIIWEVADYRKIGSLDKRGVFIALKLVAAVQQGHPPTEGVLKLPLNAPRFPNIPPSARASPSVTPGLGEWDITPVEQTKYEAIFNSLGPIDGKLCGEKVRPVLLNSSLPQNQLARIWEMADMDRDGMLDLHEMCVAMHLVYKCIETHTLPDKLPYSLARKGSLVGSRRTSAVQSPTSSGILRKLSMFFAILYLTLLAPPLSATSRASSIASLTKADTRSMASIHSDTIRQSGIKSVFDATSSDFPIDKQLWEEDFNRLDMDHDGYVTGMDTRITLMGSGLPQQILAHIWGLVDIVKTGRLNSEQFALVMELIKEAKLGIKLPEILPAHLVPPSLRMSMPHMPLSPSEKANPKVKELNDEIQKIIDDRRKADIDLAQLEADITIKSSTVKNLEIELNTLAATVKQLQNQKGEATKRLGEMDQKIEAFKLTLEEGRKRLAAEEERLVKAKADVAQAKENANAEEQIMYSLREELRNLDNNVYQKKLELNKINQTITRTATEISDMEKKMQKNATESAKIQEKKEELKKILEELERASSPTNDDPLLLKRFDELNLSGNVIGASTTTTVSTSSNLDNNAFAVDPFKSSDPFSDDSFDAFGAKRSSNAGISTATGANFGSFGKDPFAQADPFGSPAAPPNNFADFANFSAFGH
jgi:epidermal growth factor receptor substrate 15